MLELAVLDTLLNTDINNIQIVFENRAKQFI